MIIISFDELLSQAVNGEIDREIALDILKGSRDFKNGMKLFNAAACIRDEKIGKDLYLSSGISGILPCKISPMCRYCNYKVAEAWDNEKLVKAVQAIEGLGIRQTHLSGGSCLDGYDAEILSMVKAIKAVSDIDVEVNLGPSLSFETIRALKSMGVSSVTSSLETFSPAVFADAKPGDSLEMRKQLMDMCEREGMSIRSMMLIGLGESLEDRIDHLFYLRQFTRMYHLRFSRFFPTPGTPYAGRERCSPWDYATTVAVARLILPRVQLGMAAGNSADDIPLWYMAGGGNQLLGAHTGRGPGKPGPGEEVIRVSDDLVVTSRIPLLRKYVSDMGRTLRFEL